MAADTAPAGSKLQPQESRMSSSDHGFVWTRGGGGTPIELWRSPVDPTSQSLTIRFLDGGGVEYEGGLTFPPEGPWPEQEW